MKKETKRTLIVIGAVAAVFVAAYASLILYTGMSPPFYTVESGSMRHSEDSKVGIIDTGDMVIVRETSKRQVITYLEGYESGYRMFGDHGDVVLYERPGGTPVIHRAILYMEYLGGNDWNIPALDAYTGGGGGGTGPRTGTVTLTDFGWKGVTVSINLNALVTPALNIGDKGYVTMGDHNSPVYDPAFVREDRIIGVAVAEIPWFGSIKLLVTGNGGSIPPNSIWLLAVLIAVIIGTVLGIGFFYDRRKKKRE